MKYHTYSSTSGELPGKLTKLSEQGYDIFAIVPENGAPDRYLIVHTPTLIPKAEPPKPPKKKCRGLFKVCCCRCD